jgi:mRNA interferase HicA
MTKRKDVVGLLEGKGFINKGGTNHDKFEHQDGRWTAVPRHREIPEATVRKIKKQAGLL